MQAFWGGKRHASLTLYEHAKGHVLSDAWAEHILLFASDSRGTYKRTYCNRFDEFDAICMKHIANNFDFKTALNVHDVAVSDARTACDFFSKLVKKYPVMNYIASDYDSVLKVVEVGNQKVTLDTQNQPIEIVFPPFVFNLKRIDKTYLYPINHLFFLYASKFLLPRIMHRFETGELKITKSIAFFSQRAIKLAQIDHRFKLMTYDILQPSILNTPVQVIRAMNVLNPAYFDLEKLQIVIGHFFNALAQGGLLVTGSNGDSNSPVRGGIYRKRGNGFDVLWQTEELYYAHQSIADFKF
ncbi:MAG TPA: hypothetical protein PKC80_02465 [Burkholderiaceae bacterium]|nr:hypothetical protein [Burkholderiaceae bacterium]